ncbi:Mitochondrial ubiquitin ligase activator of nfkb [Thalictrum thalictroides]|uniref:RING-type E3 ubiquitin transferase n=1 Tax=Thalictrum thalictroides TaxID=46969 RepID=A0A7J6V3X6_THATH|nr:Mitochondrial ubiquitin ligase activator of nfkb [Thalictrum thalictroides]
MSTYDSVTIDLDNGLISSAIALGFFAVLKFWNYKSSSSALLKLRNAKTISVSGLRHLLSSSTEKNQLVVVRGFVQAGPKRWFSLQPNILESSTASGKIQGVVLLTTQARSVHHVWNGPSMGCTSYLGGVSTSFTKVPSFLLAGRKGSDSSSDCVTVNLSALNYDHLPLTTIFDRLGSLNAICFPMPLPVKSLLGHAYPFGLCLREKFLPLNFAMNHPGLLEEKILPLGKEISVVGIGTSEYGNVEIKPCDELTYFLSDLTKDQMIVELAHKTNYLLLSAIFLGSLSLGAIAYALMIGSQRFEEKMQERRQVEQRRLAEERRQVEQMSQVQQPMRNDVEEGIMAIPEELLCVVCYSERRGSAFVPCGHVVCCRACAPTVIARDRKCPICRQHIHKSMKVYT